MTKIVDIPVADLLVDTRNARLGEEQPDQPSALLALAKQQGQRILKLAADIADHGLDPTTLPAVIPMDNQRNRYLVLEGNRRVVALKALETPSLIAASLDAKQHTKLNKLAARYSNNPLSTIKCALFQTEVDANHWITLRHTGQNGGVGLVEWGSEEKDRWSARHGVRSPAGQILNFVNKQGHLSDDAKTSKKGIITSLKRLVNTPEVRDVLGIEQEGGKIFSWYPADEVAKGLSRIVDDLKTGDVKVGDIYHVNQRREYARNLPRDARPSPRHRLESPRPLDDIAGEASSRPKRKRRTTARASSRARTTVIPRTCHLDIGPQRINAIYNELSILVVDRFPNACSVLLRVFVELGIDHYIQDKELMRDEQRRSAPLAKRLKSVAAHLQNKGLIDRQLETAVKKMADTRFVLAASTSTFNQYVHNQYVYPKPSELLLAWDELEPFLKQIWL